MKLTVFLSTAVAGFLVIAGLAVLPALAAGPELQMPAINEDLPTVAIITTGGTIAEKTDPKSGGAVPAVTGEDLVAAVPGLKSLANIAVMNFSNIDSSQMTPLIWAHLSKSVDEVLARQDIAGAVITHGTDTMSEGAFFLDVTLKSDKPVVFTGAMNDASSSDRDGPANILSAVGQVLSSDARNWGVTVTLNRFVNSARDVRKTNTTNVQTFSSGEKGFLGYVFNGNVTRYNDRLHRLRLPLPDKLPDDLPYVPYISMFAGSDGSFIRHAVEKGAKGLAIDGVGAGNVDADMFEAIEYALSRNIPVSISTRVYNGAVEPVYGDKGGGKMLQDAGCILTGNLQGTKARLLLMIALMRQDNNPADLHDLFQQ
jgi:L-asparaginase